jgi:hypothetical protein
MDTQRPKIPYGHQCHRPFVQQVVEVLLIQVTAQAQPFARGAPRVSRGMCMLSASYMYVFLFL